MLGQRRRRWANIVPTLSESLVFAGLLMDKSKWRYHMVNGHLYSVAVKAIVIVKISSVKGDLSPLIWYE